MGPRAAASRPPDAGADAEDASWWVYLLACADGTLYCGVARDVDARVAQHNAGRGAKYTRGRLPVRVVWRERHPTRGDALRRELAVKALPRRAKLRLSSEA